MGTLRRLNEGMPIRVGAEQPTSRPALPAPTPPTATSTEVAMIDVSMLPEAGEEQVIHTEAVPACHGLYLGGLEARVIAPVM